MDLTDLITGIQNLLPAGLNQGATAIPPEDREREPAAVRFNTPELDPEQIQYSPTEFSARRRDVPLVDPKAMTAFAPTDVQRMQQGMPQIPTGNSGQFEGLLSAIVPGAGGRRISAALAGGLSSIEGNTKGGVFARGLGGGLKGANTSEKEEFDALLKTIDRAQKAKESGNNVEYKTALTDYYKSLTATKAAATAKAKQPATPEQAAIKPTPAGEEIAMKGDGTKATPYSPSTKADYDEIPSGSFYVHPKSGEIRIKK